MVGSGEKVLNNMKDQTAKESGQLQSSYPWIPTKMCGNLDTSSSH